MFVSDTERKIFKSFMFVSIILMAIGIFMNVDVIMSLFHRSAVCATNIMFVGSIFAPIILVIGFLINGGGYTVSKILRLKILFGVIAFLCLSGVLWIFHFASDYSFYELANGEKIINYQKGIKYFIGNRLFWGTFGMSGVNFSIILFIFMVANSILVSSHRLVSAGTMLATFLFRVVASCIICVMDGSKELIVQWLSFNLIPIIAEAVFLAGILFAAIKDSRWIEFVWGDRYVGNDFEDSEEDE